MKNFLIFLSIFVVILFALSDAKQRMDELDKMSKDRQIKIEQISEQPENPEEINDNIKANHN